MLITRQRVYNTKNNAERLVAHSSPQPAVVGGGGQAACVFWALLLLHAR